MTTIDPTPALPVREHPLSQGLAAAKANALAGLGIILLSVGILVGYHTVPPLTRFFDAIAEFKLATGIWFGIVSTALFGAVFPIFVQQLRTGTRRANAWRKLPFITLFWAYKGAEIDLLYRAQAHVIGDNAEPLTIAIKVFFDQFIYCAFFAVPTTLLAYAWAEAGFNWARMWQQLGPRWYRNRCIPVLIANWFVWVPTTAIIYQLKLPLQLPVQNLVLCLWSILLLSMTNQREEVASD